MARIRTTSTEAERVASGIRSFKTAYRSIIISKQSGNLNLIQLKSLVELNVLKLVYILMRNGNRGMIQNLLQNLLFFNQMYIDPTKRSH